MITMVKKSSVLPLSCSDMQSAEVHLITDDSTTFSVINKLLYMCHMHKSKCNCLSKKRSSQKLN